jgi:4-hydroxythreonine-4-phosphate dehydrogenase
VKKKNKLHDEVTSTTSQTDTGSAIIISQGDAAGVAWPLLLNLLEKKTGLLPEERKKLSDVIVVGEIFANQEKKISQIFEIIKSENRETDFSLPQKRKKPLFIATGSGMKYEPGVPSAPLALKAHLSFQKALKLWQKLPSASLVTLPVSKEYIMKAGINFTGHTEVLAASSDKKVFMCMYHPRLSVIPLTNHIPLAQVSRRILETDFTALSEALHFYRNLFKSKKKTALAGLNPHAGENGKIGNEESFLKQKLEELSKKGLEIEGPFGADGLFSPKVRNAYDLIITNYHDQGLIPFKALYGLAGLNITLNLPKLRVSPDHGTAYTAAAKGEGDVTGILTALKFAIKWGKKWTEQYSTLS